MSKHLITVSVDWSCLTKISCVCSQWQLYQQTASGERSHITSNKKHVQSQQGVGEIIHVQSQQAVEKLLATG